MGLPSFLILGVAKCGTSALYDYITEHPHVKKNQKEVGFFNTLRYEDGVRWYSTNFGETTDKIIAGEATPLYATMPSCAKKIKALFPNIKMIMMLRDPVERAWSQYRYFQHFFPNSQSFAKQLKKEPTSRNTYAQDNQYLQRGRYIEHVKRFHKHFPKDQLLIIHTEDFTTDKRWFVGSKTVQEQMEEVYEFLSLEPYHCQIRYQKKNESPDDTLDPDIRQWLIDYYRPYNYELYDYLGRGFFWQD